MTFKAWLLTTWGRIRETLQPELFVLRRELREALAQRDEARAVRNDFMDVAMQANRRTADLSERLAQRTRELKAARAKLKKLESRDPAIKEYAEILRRSKIVAKSRAGL